jgi:hypothetical protein
MILFSSTIRLIMELAGSNFWLSHWTQQNEVKGGCHGQADQVKK